MTINLHFETNLTPATFTTSPNCLDKVTGTERDGDQKVYNRCGGELSRNKYPPAEARLSEVYTIGVDRWGKREV